jgi:hypothetical protein
MVKGGDDLDCARSPPGAESDDLAEATRGPLATVAGESMRAEDPTFDLDTHATVRTPTISIEPPSTDSQVPVLLVALRFSGTSSGA